MERRTVLESNRPDEEADARTAREGRPDKDELPVLLGSQGANL